MTRRRILAVVCAVGLTAGLAACGSDDNPSSGSGTTALRIGYTGAAPPSFDPHSGATGSFQAIYPAYDTLLHIDAKGETQPWLATEYKIVNPKTHELKLHTGVKFTDGTAFDAAAVKANIENARDFQPGTGAQVYLKEITDVQVVDPTTVRLVLAAPNPGLPVDFTGSVGEMVSPKALANKATLASAPAGTGPYVVDTAATRQGTTLAWKRNPDYWGDKKVFPYDTITYTFGQDPTAIRNAAQAGTLDLLDVRPGDPVPAGFETLNSTSGGAAGFTGIWLDVTGTTQPALKDVRVRQAINYAIDRETIAKTVYEGAATPTAGVPITEDSPAYTDALAGMYGYDANKAQQLLADAGFPNGFSMKLLALPVAESFAQAIAADLRKVGITAQITSVAGPDLPKQLLSGTYTAGLLLQGMTGDPGQDLSGLFSPNAFFNVHKASDPKITAQLGAAAAITDEAARNKAYQDATKYAADQSWFAGTMLLQQITAFKPNVVKVTPPPFGQIFVYHYTAP